MSDGSNALMGLMGDGRPLVEERARKKLELRLGRETANLFQVHEFDDDGGLADFNAAKAHGAAGDFDVPLFSLRKRLAIDDCESLVGRTGDAVDLYSVP